MNFGNQQFDQQQFQSAFMNTHTAFAPQRTSHKDDFCLTILLQPLQKNR